MARSQASPSSTLDQRNPADAPSPSPPAALFAGFLSLHAVTPAHAATCAAFTQQAFKAAQAADRPILVDISATWCPTCAQQKPIIDSLSATPEFSELVILHVDFDTQKDVVRAMGARMQSTSIVFHGTTPKGALLVTPTPTRLGHCWKRVGADAS